MHYNTLFARKGAAKTGLLFDLLRLTGVPFHAEPYGVFHLAFLLLGVPAAVAAACLIPRRGDASETRLFFSFGVILAVGETYKQLFYPAVEGAWRADLFPFQLCSVPMYICLLLPCLHGRAREAAMTFLATFGLMGGVASYIAPGTMLRPYLAMALHSFLWHLALIFLGVRASFSVREHTARGFLGAARLYLGLCLAAFGINLAFHASHPEVNMFYLGPTPSPLPLCRDITARLGVAANSALYISALTAAAALVYAAWAVLRAVASKKKGHTDENK